MGLLEDKVVLGNGGSRGSWTALVPPSGVSRAERRVDVARLTDASRWAWVTSCAALRRTGHHLPGRNAVEASLIAEACAMSLREHRPLRLDEVRKW
ncbi:hypothetical protein ACGFY3_07795 [Streptomyces mirabilis]|uniref:hypothetical protein n=1 Tax=Streptomyces mirabilis TaxID=68239 RepID=UPI003716E991